MRNVRLILYKTIGKNGCTVAKTKKTIVRVRKNSATNKKYKKKKGNDKNE